MSAIIERIRARREGAPSLPIEIEEWDLRAFIRPISAGKMAALQKQGNPAQVAAQVIIHGLVDKDGKPVFADDADSMAALTGEDHALVNRVAAEIIGRPTSLDEAKNS